MGKKPKRHRMWQGYLSTKGQLVYSKIRGKDYAGSTIRQIYICMALILETGLRTGEMIGLTRDAIDWKNRTLTVNKTLEYRYKQRDWQAGPQKPAKLPNHSADQV